jgi:hypothetical protein
MPTVKLFPSTGTPDSVIERLREYADPLDPDLFRRVRGADADMIAAYSKLAGFHESNHSMPASYLAFLETMGLEDGGLLQQFRIEARLPSLIDFYQEAFSVEPEILNPDLPVIATYIVGDQISFDCTTALPEPEVVESSCGELMGPFSQSWEHLLMQVGMLHLEASRFAHGRWFSGPAKGKTLDVSNEESPALIIDAFAKNNGLETAWPSDSLHRIATGERACIFATLSKDNAVLFWAFSSDMVLMRKIADELAPALGCTATGASKFGRRG